MINDKCITTVIVKGVVICLFIALGISLTIDYLMAVYQ
tara:strand:- start:877 stop:990 length:114 start_codon:yes stop_codon:yes gene_type:complete